MRRHPPKSLGTQLTSHPGLHYPVGKPSGLSPSVLLLRKISSCLFQSCKHHSKIQHLFIATRHHSATREEEDL